MKKDEIGSRLKKVRKALHHNQEVVSQKLAITKQTLSRYENGIRFPDSLFLQTFVIEFNVDANWLFCGTGDMFLEKSRELGLRQGPIQRIKYHTDCINDIITEVQKKGEEIF